MVVGTVGPAPSLCPTITPTLPTTILVILQLFPHRFQAGSYYYLPCLITHTHTLPVGSTHNLDRRSHPLPNLLPCLAFLYLTHTHHHTDGQVTCSFSCQVYAYLPATVYLPSTPPHLCWILTYTCLPSRGLPTFTGPATGPWFPPFPHLPAYLPGTCPIGWTCLCTC